MTKQSKTYRVYIHYDVIKWKHFPRYWSFVLMFSLICAWIKTRDAGDLRRHRAHHDAMVMVWEIKDAVYQFGSQIWYLSGHIYFQTTVELD